MDDNNGQVKPSLETTMNQKKMILHFTKTMEYFLNLLDGVHVKKSNRKILLPTAYEKSLDKDC